MTLHTSSSCNVLIRLLLTNTNPFMWAEHSCWLSHQQGCPAAVPAPAGWAGMGFLPASCENPLGCTKSFPGLKRINCLESFCISKVDLLNTSQLLGIVTAVLQSAHCLDFCSCFSDFHFLIYVAITIRWKLESKNLGFERTTCRSIFVQFLPCSWKPKPCKVPSPLKVGLGKVQLSWAQKHLTWKDDLLYSGSFSLFTFSSTFFSQRYRKLFQICISSYFIIKRTLNEFLFTLINF